MADVIPEGSRDRAQLLLVGALALAVVLLSLSLLLNSVIYTENLATRQTDADTEEAASFRFEVVYSLGDAIEHANRNDASSFSDRRNRYGDAADEAADMLANYSANDGLITEVDRRSVHEGTRVANADPSTGLVPQDGSGDWTVATDSKVRNVYLHVNASTVDSGDDVRLVFDDGTARTLIIEEGGSGPQLRVEGAPGDNTCRLTEGEIDVSAGQVDGRRCPALAGVRLADEQDVSITNGDQVDGTFSMVLDRREVGFRTAVDVANYPNQCSPPTTPTYNDTGTEGAYTSRAIYAGTAHVSVESKQLDHERSVRAAPGEDGDPPTEPTFATYDVRRSVDYVIGDWNTTDPDDDIAHVDIRVYNISADTTERLLSDAPANGSTTFADVSNDSAYYINGTVVDATSSRRVSQIRHPDGDAGCPP
jgi:hypothetical protein